MVKKDTHIFNNWICKKSILIVSFLLISNLVLSQKETSNWIMGLWDVWVVFTDSGPVPYSPPNNIQWQVDFFESSGNASSVSDKNGNLLMYTNGETVWDASLNEMYGGSYLIGNMFGRSLIIPSPESSNRYYALGTEFPINYPNTFDYSVSWLLIDLSYQNGLGQPVVTGELGVGVDVDFHLDVVV